ncbi:MAG: leucyl aminopeptidase, partial [Syntrophales bacterium]|nr:leucyl aminopeptidase [Syntrophales bacterium]
DDICGGGVRAALASGGFLAKHAKTAVVYPRGAPWKRLILVGLGPREKTDGEKLRNAFARAAAAAREAKACSIAVDLATLAFHIPLGDVAFSIVEAFRLGLYAFRMFKTTDDDDHHEIGELKICIADGEGVETVRNEVRAAEIISDAVVYVRDLVNTPANLMTPYVFAAEAAGLMEGRPNLRVEVLDTEQIRLLGMNAFLGVAKGSAEPPVFVILEYKGGGGENRPIVLVGKGLTFDSGGISLKPAEKMDEMKTDMAGAAAVLGVIRAVADLQLPLRVMGLCPLTENMPGGKATKPGDILTSLAGKTIEVINTDAEGRLILADALAYAQRLRPAAILDLATLTGACVVALGEIATGMFVTDERLRTLIKESAIRTGERVWELPLWDEYAELIKGEVADLKNTGGRPAGAITAAVFLKHFVGDYPWVHLDIAGTAFTAKDRPYQPKGATGVGVRLLTDMLRHLPGDFLY